MNLSVVLLCLRILIFSLLLQSQFRESLASSNLVSAVQSSPLKIAAFNIQVFGKRKMTKKLVRDTLIKILNRYDIVLVQEIRSTSNNAIKDLLRRLNNAAAPNEYGMELSVRLGRTFSKEQYAFLYRKDRVSVKDSYLYDDAAKGDQFEREPFVVLFHSPGSWSVRCSGSPCTRGTHALVCCHQFLGNDVFGQQCERAYIKDFAIGGIHVSPGKAPSEISNLVDVYDDIISRWKLNDVILMGDFNAGCSYVTKKDWKKIRLATDRRFYWAFTDNQDTTVAKSDCPYDRMVMAGENMVRAVLPASAKAFRFDIAYDLDQAQSELVSDHYPIEIQLKDSSYKDEELYIKKALDVVIKDVRHTSISNSRMYPLRSKKNQLLKEGYKTYSEYSKSGATISISLTKETTSTDEAVSALLTMQRHFPKLISSTQAIAATRSIQRISGFQASECFSTSSSDEGWVYQVIPNPPNPLSNFSIKMVKLVCDLKNSECLLTFQNA